MRRKRTRLLKWLICSVVMVFVLNVSGCTEEQRLVKEGRYLRADNGIHFLIDGELPIQICNQDIGEVMFDGLETGDLIQVVHDPIRETYPAKATVYSCVRLECGTRSDIPNTVIDDLAEHGFLTSGTVEGEK